MTKEEIQASIKSIMFSGSVCGIEIYACLRDESGYQTKKIRATDKLLSSTKDKSKKSLHKIHFCRNNT